MIWSISMPGVINAKIVANEDIPPATHRSIKKREQMLANTII